jgi:eukaryotic-like serine/threonine-protein kinase
VSTIAGDERTQVAKARHLAPEKLSRLVEADLDWIVMKAIDKNRSRRYETANGLALDIRHTSAQAVANRHGTPWTAPPASWPTSPVPAKAIWG